LQEPVPAEIRIPALERRVQQSQLAEQHAELVQVAEALLQRTRALSWASVVLALVVCGLLIAVLGR